MARPRAFEDDALLDVLPGTVKGIAAALHANESTVRDKLDALLEASAVEVFRVGGVKVWLVAGDRPFLHDLLPERSEVGRLLDHLPKGGE